MPSVAYRFASERDLIEYYSERPKQTLRAVVLTLNDQPAAVIGVARQNDCGQFFSEYKSQFRPHLKSMATLRALKQAMQIVKESKLPVYAMAEEQEPDAVRILARLGFIRENENVFRWQP